MNKDNLKAFIKPATWMLVICLLLGTFIQGAIGLKQDSYNFHREIACLESGRDFIDNKCE